MLFLKSKSIFLVATALTVNAAVTQYPAKPLVDAINSQFGPFIEGTAVDDEGNIFAVNHGNSARVGTIGQVTPQELFYEDKTAKGTAFNGIRFFVKDDKTFAYAADYINHRVVELTINDDDITSKNFCASPDMIQPNDLALSRAGLLFLSGTKWKPNNQAGDGDLWVCSPAGVPQRLETLGRTNGIELSPDDKYLYLSEAANRNGAPVSNKIWRYDVNPATGAVSNKKVFFDFLKIQTQHIDIDGMRTDIKGNLFVTRNGGSEVLKMSPNGDILASIKTTFTFPSNIEFGGPNGTTLYIVGRCGINTPHGHGVGCVDTWENDAPGRAWWILQDNE
ncbi:calcium-dependent phosphotriesterase [Basidiobolus meristosporus CBS 931.73]|uniref:Calcium-dependent phosphotriesterase n=1 Tax=Basidiobolus meristosporus CBS 931.73 TaxID=1314790 RepID=A0A1Y1Y060_9FUNG|nr:calcium-dependent phosphotriesterase [Basidiobolus meristosporus CBS 931.73]|eukprot:ORX91285.1 calcium-dependent phosphotriesterase [Basidiobolus meristosporus CBS 931.73]